MNIENRGCKIHASDCLEGRRITEEKECHFICNALFLLNQWIVGWIHDNNNSWGRLLRGSLTWPQECKQ